MPSDRIFKFSIPGLMFILTFIFFYKLFGGDIQIIVNNTKDKNLVAVVGLVFSTPVIGVIFSTIAVVFLQWCCGYKIWYYPPEKSLIIHYTLKKNKELKKKIFRKGKPDWTDKDVVKEYYPYYQAKIRNLLGGEQISFLDRRWSAYWIHVNNLAMTLFSLIAAIITRVEESSFYWGKPHLSSFTIIGLLALGFYCRTAWINLNNSKDDATKTEHLMLEDAIRKEQNAKRSSERQQPEQKAEG